MRPHLSTQVVTIIQFREKLQHIVVLRMLCLATAGLSILSILSIVLSTAGLSNVSNIRISHSRYYESSGHEFKCFRYCLMKQTHLELCHEILISQLGQ